MQNLTQVEIAEKLGLDSRTVAYHVSQISNKCATKGKKNVINFFRKNGIKINHELRIYTKIKIINIYRQGNRNQKLIAKRTGATSYQVRKIIEKYKTLNFEIISEPPIHKVYLINHA